MGRAEVGRRASDRVGWGGKGLSIREKWTERVKNRMAAIGRKNSDH